MAKHVKLTAQTRLGAGRTAVNKIKAQGLVPAVIYGGKDKPQNLQINAREIRTVLSHASSEHVLVDLEIADGDLKGSRLALIQEVQHHPLRGEILHVDFHAVSANEKLHAEIPVQAMGEPAGVKNFGGILEIAMHAIEIECLPKDLPEIIQIDVSGLNVGDAIHIKDVQLPAGVTARAEADQTVIRVAPPTVEVEAVPAAAAVTSPEVLKEKKEEPAAEKK